MKQQSLKLLLRRPNPPGQAASSTQHLKDPASATHATASNSAPALPAIASDAGPSSSSLKRKATALGQPEHMRRKDHKCDYQKEWQQEKGLSSLALWFWLFFAGV